MEDLFASLGRAGIERGDLYLAWDFTVGSRKSIAGRAARIRDRALADLGDAAPTSVPGACPPGDPTEHPVDPEITRVCGTFTVPCFLDSPTCASGSRFPFADATSNDPVRTAGSTMLANYDCICRPPRPATRCGWRSTATGLLGDASEVDLAPQRSMVKRHNFAYCATDWKGMATEDDPNVALILNDFSRFPSLTDRVQQGILDFIFLGRLMKKGFPSDPRFAGPARHRAPVLRRQQPGRDLRRDADRGLARHRALRARRAGNETTRRCCSARPTSASTRR
jgi:hypothetical protein